MCRRGVKAAEFAAYCNFVLKADKVCRSMLDDSGRLVPYEARAHALRALVEKYVKLGLKREILAELLFNVLSLKLD